MKSLKYGRMLTRSAATMLDLFPWFTVFQHLRQLPVLIHRLMVECSSPGDVRLHVVDQLPPPPVQPTPAMATVQLRIATGDCLYLPL